MVRARGPSSISVRRRLLSYLIGLGREAEALELGEELAQLARAHNDLMAEAQVALEMGGVLAQSKSDHEEKRTIERATARTFYKSALALAEQTSSPELEGQALVALSGDVQPVHRLYV